MESDSRCDELEAQKKLLEGHITDLQEQLTQQTVADDHIVTLVQTRAQEWEVYGWGMWAGLGVHLWGYVGGVSRSTPGCI